MPWTNFPNGISLTTATGTVSGQLTATTGSFAGTLTIGSATQIIGAYTLIPVYFGTASALEQKSVSVGFPSCSLDGVYHSVSATSALVANYTVQVGSAGAVAVATVANTTSSVGVIQALTTTATTFDGTSSALVCIRSVQGTTGETVLTLVVRRSA